MNQRTRKVLHVFLFILSTVHIVLSILFLSEIINVKNSFIIGWILLVVGLILSLTSYKLDRIISYELIPDIIDYQSTESKINI